MEEKSKFECIIDGAIEKATAEEPRREYEEFYQASSQQSHAAACQLAMIIKNLTSTNKDARERAKKEVRELVKIGKEVKA